jgi:hypothetical protein
LELFVVRMFAEEPLEMRKKLPRGRHRLGRGHEILFDGVPLDKMSVSMTMNGAVLTVLARHPQRGHGAEHPHLSDHALDDALV